MKLQSAGALYPTDYKLRPTGQGRLRLHEHRTTKCDSFWAEVCYKDIAIGQGKLRQRYIARPKAQLLGGRGVFSLCSAVGPLWAVDSHLSSFDSSES
ncbi:hypothetical protein BBV17_20070 [Cytobacillus oceanisediminis]|uniref:Uncharacterized protein n=1 Tax=Cytobacillus oceanisediminis TaxID=665099 RepID=A0ABX3CS37_9BACI|nr:hypothetical protein BBV17_20070 [Cytobacillus oceanisediminis]